MKLGKDGLDEMQKQVRDKIGNQSFFLMFYLLLLNTGLSSMGLQWVNHPMDIMIILVGVMGLNLVRIILKNAYVGPTTKKRSVKGLLLAAGISIAIAVLIMATDLRTLLNVQTQPATDNSAMILFIISSVTLVIALVVTLIKKKQNKDE